MVQPFSNMRLAMTRRGREVQESITRIVREAARVVDERVVLDTPVDTGRARSNWVVTRDFPFTTTIPPYAEGQLLGKGEQANAQAAIAQGAGAVARFQIPRNRGIFITNNIEYIGILNNVEGASAQTSPGFVQQTIASAQTAVRGERLLRR